MGGCSGGMGGSSISGGSSVGTSGGVSGTGGVEGGMFGVWSIRKRIGDPVCAPPRACHGDGKTRFMGVSCIHVGVDSFKVDVGCPAGNGHA